MSDYKQYWRKPDGANASGHRIGSSLQSRSPPINKLGVQRLQLRFARPALGFIGRLETPSRVRRSGRQSPVDILSQWRRS